MARGRRLAAGLQIVRSVLLCFSGALLLAGSRAAAEEIVPGLMERDIVLEPNLPKQVKVAIGQAKFLNFRCNGGPADVVISLSTYAEHADPLLFLSLNPAVTPSFKSHDASSFGQWREDAAGDHYVIAKAVSPKGGILGLVNMRHFAGEELNGILSIHCTFIVAFDTLFWDHLRSSAVCPWGRSQQDPPQQDFCSGNGQCTQHGVCSCDGDHVGPACEHLKSDMVVAAEGKYRFKVATGRYQYFRVRVPPRFQGGFLEVRTESEQPLVVLVRGDDLPTKTNYELSNFDDWVNAQNTSLLKYKVDAPIAPPTAEGGHYSPYTGMPQGETPEGADTGRRLSWAEGAPVTSWASLFSRAWQDRTVDLEVRGEAEVASELLRRRQPQSAAPRTLQGPQGLLNPSQVVCPRLPAKSAETCRAQSFGICQAKCMTCVSCTKESSDGCSSACDACVSPGCINTLALCAGDVSCKGPEAMQCEAGCGSCMTCFDSNDANCQGCQCCIDCLPVAAKCSGMSKQPADQYNRFVFVGVYNHRRFKSDRDLVHAVADISLKADPNFGQMPSSWIADLYNPFQDMRSYRITKGPIYPDGEQFIYELDLNGFAQTVHEQVRLYHDRVTLVFMKNRIGASNMVLRFPAGPNVTHVLSTSRSAPKTLFDFDTEHTRQNAFFEVDARNEPAIWCAVFGAADGFLQVSATSYGEVPSAPVPIGFALVCVFGLLCALLVLGVIYGGAQKLGERFGLGPTVPLTDRLANWGLARGNPHESTASLTRSGSLSGYVGSEVIDRSVEDQYLHRGGIGDDGI